jgi:hypothetical protein
MLYRDRLELYFTSATIALASAQDIQVLIPILLPNGAHQNFNLALGVASAHSGGFGDYDELQDYNFLPTIPFPSLASATTVASITRSSADVNSVSSQKPFVVSIDTAVKGRIGEFFDAKIDMDCNSVLNPQCRITTAGQFYSITLCGRWDFMNGGRLEVDN